MKLHLFVILWILIGSLVIDTIRDTSICDSESIEWSDMDDIEDKETKEDKKSETEKIFVYITTLFYTNKDRSPNNRPQFEMVLTTQNIKSSDNQPPEFV